MKCIQFALRAFTPKNINHPEELSHTLICYSDETVSFTRDSEREFSAELSEFFVINLSRN